MASFEPDGPASALVDATARASLDSSRSRPVSVVNGAPETGSETRSPPARAEPDTPAPSAHLPPTDDAEPDPAPEPPAAPEDDAGAELVQLRHEKAALEEQYNSLLSKLTTMRSTLGGKLKQDADELDLRAQRISTLQASNDDLNFTVETLRSELIASNDDLESAHRELEAARARAADAERAELDDAGARETALRDAQEDLERIRSEREAWEIEAGHERVGREEALQAQQALERDLAALRAERDTLRSERDAEAQSARNLHVVLEEFQAAKDRELRETLGDLQTRLQTTSKALTEQRARADDAQRELEAIQANFEQSLVLQQEVKEKNLLIGKLRHEAVILNEHLTEALRRLKKDSTENNVDRRLITNVLISFFNTPRADSKRFEMLSLLASILSWSEEDRERAGLQRTGSSGLAAPNGSPASSRSGRPRGHSRTSATGPKGKQPDDGLGDNETFSNLWIEFLLREANQSPSAKTPVSNPFNALTSPTTLMPNASRYPLPEIPQSPSPSGTASSTRRGSITSSTGPSSRAPSAVGEPPDRGKQPTR